MSIACRIGFHAWNGCECRKCGRVDNKRHEWRNCKCERCGAVRNEGHDWRGCKCERCGAVRNEGHEWGENYNWCEICNCTQTPTKDQLINLPLRAMAAFSAGCARKVQRLYDTWPLAPAKCAADLECALKLVERAAHSTHHAGDDFGLAAVLRTRDERPPDKGEIDDALLSVEVAWKVASAPVCAIRAAKSAWAALLCANEVLLALHAHDMAEHPVLGQGQGRQEHLKLLARQSKQSAAGWAGNSATLAVDAEASRESTQLASRAAQVAMIEAIRSDFDALAGGLRSE